MWRLWVTAGILAAVSAVLGWTYYEGKKAGIAEVEHKIQIAVQEEKQRMEDLNREAMKDAEERIAALAEQVASLESENAELDKQADNDDSVGGLDPSRLRRIGKIHSQ